MSFSEITVDTCDVFLEPLNLISDVFDIFYLSCQVHTTCLIYFLFDFKDEKLSIYVEFFQFIQTIVQINGK